MLNLGTSTLLTPPLSHDWIAQHIPHQGQMCLLHEVRNWDAENICCLADSHRDVDNPLRTNGRLGIMCGIEYAAQAMAVHCAIIGGRGGGAGFIAALREVSCCVTRLDGFDGKLEIRAQRHAALPSGAMYGFSLWHQQQPLQSGRITLMFSQAGKGES